jgi:hypothetical protein
MKDELSPQEQSELDNIAGLHSAEECEAFLRSIPQLSFTDTLTLSNAQLYRADKTEKEYSLSLSFNSQDDQRSLYADFDAVRGRITSLNNYSYYSDYDNDQPLTEAQIKDGNAQIDSFLDLVIKDKLPEFELISDKPSEKLYSVSRRYRRIVNGIPYISNTLNVNYSPSKERIVYYNLNYEDNAQFADPSTAIDADTAYTYLLAQSPLKKKYIRSGDLYRLVYGISGSPQIDAFTGGSLYENSSYTPTETVYNDISGHWCETAVNALRDYGIALNGESFEPDTAITQSDLLRLFALGIKARDLDISSNDDLYNLCYSYGILTNDERSDDTPLTREQAFIYMIRFAGYENIAKLPDIYKVEYADGNMLTSGNIGYAAILSGMGVLCGDGGYLRPQDNITRAETAAMLYKYMTN